MFLEVKEYFTFSFFCLIATMSKNFFLNAQMYALRFALLFFSRFFFSSLTVVSISHNTSREIMAVW